MYDCKKLGGDIQKFLAKLPFTTTGIPGELHLPGHNFVGPGTNLNIRLNTDLQSKGKTVNSPKEWSKPIDIDDEIAYLHDLAYREAENNLEKKHEADKIMLQQLNSITDPTIKKNFIDF